jgi:hypothetical protein
VGQVKQGIERGGFGGFAQKQALSDSVWQHELNRRGVWNAFLAQCGRAVVDVPSVAFTEPTCNRVLVWLVGAILARGRRTVTALLWTMRGLAPGHPSSSHRVLSRARWLPWPLGKVLAAFVVALCEEPGREGWIRIAAEDDSDCRRGYRGVVGSAAEVSRQGTSSGQGPQTKDSRGSARRWWSEEDRPRWAQRHEAPGEGVR